MINIPSIYRPYLSGENFSAGLKVKYHYDNTNFINSLTTRHHFLSEIVKDKIVLHIGC